MVMFPVAMVSPLQKTQLVMLLSPVLNEQSPLASVAMTTVPPTSLAGRFRKLPFPSLSTEARTEPDSSVQSVRCAVCEATRFTTCVTTEVDAELIDAFCTVTEG